MIILTAVTVIILFYYTRETYLLRKESQKQTSNLLTPYLALKRLDGALFLKNLGKGIAKEIIFSSEVQINGNFILNIPVIGPDEEKPLLVSDKESNGFWSVRYTEIPNSLSFVYWDTLSNKYCASFVKLSQYQTGFSELSQRKI